MRRALVPALAVVLGGAAPTAASAAEPGLHVDPGSPAGKEYALPLDQARREARGGDSSSGGAGAQKSPSGRAALFGAGITPSSGGGAGKPAGGTGTTRSGGSDAPAPGSEAARRLSATATASSSSPVLTDGGIALAVLVAAGALGLLFRRVLR